MSNVLNSDNSNTRISITGQDTENTSLRLMNLTIKEMAGSGVNFVQSSILYKPDRSTLNVGIGRRILSADEKTMYGLNAFLDYAPNYSHQRASLGLELRSAAFELNANQYVRISDWEKGENSNNERVMDGQEIELGMQIPYVPAAKLYAARTLGNGVVSQPLKARATALSLMRWLVQGSGSKPGSKTTMASPRMRIL